jgi:hypothetical protein
MPNPVITGWLKGFTARPANLIGIVRYVEHHPVSAGLAANPGDWPWSSARLAGESACPTIAVKLQADACIC